MTIFTVTFFITNLLFFFSKAFSTTDTITPLQSLPDGSTLVSQDGTFEFGFFSVQTFTNRYVGIWFKNIPIKTIVWVANRDHPLKENSSTLSINKEGNLVLLTKNGTVHWSTNATKKALNPIVQLLDTGNLVLRDGHNNNNNDQDLLWQSFDYPSDTLLPGMKLGWDKMTGLNRRVTAWKKWDDPSPGDFSWGITLDNNPEMVLWKGTSKYHRSGPWNGVRFSGAFSGSNKLSTHPLFLYKLVNNGDEAYYTYNLTNSSMISIVVMNQTIYRRQRIIWIPENRTWRLFQTAPRDICDTYNPCGSYANCMVNESPVCQCIEGFVPKSSQNSETKDLTQGCVRRELWTCKVQGKDGFRRFEGLKFPDTTHSWVNRSMKLEDCRAKCLENCSCTAYANLDIRGGGSGCSIWFGDLIDLKVVAQSGQFLYIRMADSKKDAKDNHKKKAVLISTTIPPIVLIGILFAVFYNYRRKRKSKDNNPGTTLPIVKKDEAGGQEDMELPLFDLATLVNATNNFSIDNKLGQGGFGPVYKGVLENRQEIAVKRLSGSSGQGLKEFKNEVILCAKLQHRNLVKVLGCCIEGEEKMLLYEYMPNKSLDSFLFDSTQSKILDWSKRFHIIRAIARGLLYLHQDSRLRIIHRDLKASNILLDNNLNPKISDFGMARMCGGDQMAGNTNRVVGTYGYMAPEYVIHGIFSTKSDVFSFGVLLLEIVTGKKNRELTYPFHSHNLIGHAWKLWKEGIPSELIDNCLEDSCILSEALRCIHIGLLCLQRQPNDRPNMASVVVMLNSESDLPQPNEPGFLIDRITNGEESQLRNQTTSSTNDVTISLIDAR